MAHDTPPPHARPNDPTSGGSTPQSGQSGQRGRAGAGSGRPQQNDSLRGSRTSAAWIFAVVLLILIVLLAVFVLQNTQPVHVSFFGFDGTAPLAGVTLIAAAAGLVIAVVAGGMRILQLRRRIKRERKA